MTLLIVVRSRARSNAVRRYCERARSLPTFEYGFRRPFLFPRFSVRPWYPIVIAFGTLTLDVFCKVGTSVDWTRSSTWMSPARSACVRELGSVMIRYTTDARCTFALL